MAESARERRAPDRTTPERTASRRRSPTLPAPTLAPPPLAVGGRASSGQTLAEPTRERLETSFGMDLSAVRLNTGPQAEQANVNLASRAFTYGPQIFLGRNERPTDVGLIAHEVTHVVQQQGAQAIQKSCCCISCGCDDAAEREARSVSAAVVRGEPATVSQRVTSPQVQRLGISDVLDYFADKANIIPGFRMFTILLGVNPINMSRVDRSAANILRAIIEFIPGGGLITQALDNYGIFDKIGNWVDEQLRSLGLSGATIKNAISQFIDSLSWSDIFSLGDVWQRAKRIFTEPIEKIINFAKTLVTGIITFIKDAILMPLAKLAEGTRGWDLLIAILGKNPITGESVPRNADTLIGGFMKLIGQEETWANMKKANAVARAWSWFQTAMTELLGFVQEIPSLFMAALKALELADIILVPRALAKVAHVFGSFLGRFISWAGNALWNLLEIIFSVVAPGAMPYLKKVMAAFKTILKNPIGFVMNLVKAGKQGFQQFADNIGKHLKAALLEWLTGSLPGIYIPKSFDFMEIVKFVLSVLGLTWQNIRGKLVKLVGEPAVKAMELGFQIVMKLVTEGPAAAWEEIKKTLGNLRDMAMQAIMDFVIDTVVKKAVAKIISLLVPGGAFIQAILTIYDTIMVFIAKLQKIIQVAKAFLDGIIEIANGNIGPAAKKVESVMAGLLVLVISFLAGFAGLGKIADKVMNIINTKVRAPIDKALDKVADWIAATAKKLFAKAFGPSKPGEPDNEASRKIKDDVKRELSGKTIVDSQQASTLLGGIFAKYSAQGLKGLRIVFDPNKPDKAGIKVSASIAEVVANLPVTPTGLAAALRYARKFDYMAADTVLYVYYDLDNKSYGGQIKNASLNEHAEQVFKNRHLGKLKKQIADDRAANRLRTPPGQPVRVELNLNRIPCPICSSVLDTLASSNPDLKFAVQAVSASNKVNAEITTDYIATLIAANIEVSTSKIFDAILAKIVEILKASQAKQIALDPNDFVELGVAIPRIKENISKEKALQDMINDAQKRADKKKGLTGVPPVGSGA